jgi:uncharacterized RDD family membrane protein YckC
MSDREPSFLGGDTGEARLAGPRVASLANDLRITRPPPLATRPARDAAPTFHAAGFWRRLGGAIIDLAIIAPVCLLLGWLAGNLTGIHLPAARYRSLDFWLDLLLASDPALVGGLGLSIAIALIYALIFQVATGRTPGMRAVGARVIDLYGDDPTVRRSLLRTAGYLAALGTLGLGFLWIAFDSEKRGLHDYLSGTFVVKA